MYVIPLSWIYAYLCLGHFDLPNFQRIFEYGEWNTPFVIRPNILPPNGVTLTLSSEYLDFAPSTLSFSSSSPSALFSLRLKGLSIARVSTFNIYFWVAGADAKLYSTPATATINWNVDLPTRMRIL